MFERRQCGGQLTLPLPQRGLTSRTTDPPSRDRLDPTRCGPSREKTQRPEAVTAFHPERFTETAVMGLLVLSGSTFPFWLH